MSVRSKSPTSAKPKKSLRETYDEKVQTAVNEGKYLHVTLEPLTDGSGQSKVKLSTAKISGSEAYWSEKPFVAGRTSNGKKTKGNLIESKKRPEMVYSADYRVMGTYADLAQYLSSIGAIQPMTPEQFWEYAQTAQSKDGNSFYTSRNWKTNQRYMNELAAYKVDINDETKKAERKAESQADYELLAELARQLKLDANAETDKTPNYAPQVTLRYGTGDKTMNLKLGTKKTSGGKGNRGGGKVILPREKMSKLGENEYLNITKTDNTGKGTKVVKSLEEVPGGAHMLTGDLSRVFFTKPETGAVNWFALYLAGGLNPSAEQINEARRYIAGLPISIQRTGGGSSNIITVQTPHKGTAINTNALTNMNNGSVLRGSSPQPLSGLPPTHHRSHNASPQPLPLQPIGSHSQVPHHHRSHSTSPVPQGPPRSASPLPLLQPGGINYNVNANLPPLNQ